MLHAPRCGRSDREVITVIVVLRADGFVTSLCGLAARSAIPAVAQRQMDR